MTSLRNCFYDKRNGFEIYEGEGPPLFNGIDGNFYFDVINQHVYIYIFKWFHINKIILPTQSSPKSVKIHSSSKNQILVIDKITFNRLNGSYSEYKIKVTNISSSNIKLINGSVTIKHISNIFNVCQFPITIKYNNSIILVMSIKTGIGINGNVTFTDDSGKNYILYL